MLNNEEVFINHDYPRRNLQKKGGGHRFNDCIIQKKQDYYEDINGNKIIGLYNELEFVFRGHNSVIEIGENVYLKNCKVCVCNNSRIMFGDNVDFMESTINIDNEATVEIKYGCKISNIELDVGNKARVVLNRKITIMGDRTRWSISDKARVEVGDRGRFWDGTMRLAKNTLLKIGNDFSVGYKYNIVLYEQTRVIIGEDCMFSYEVYLRSNDGHSIFDIKSGKNINSTEDIRKSRMIIIGNHVWVGMRATILYNTKIGDGSIVGAASLVKGIFPNNCIIGGITAKVIKTDIAWSRKQGANDIIECGKDYVRLTEEMEKNDISYMSTTTNYK